MKVLYYSATATAAFAGVVLGSPLHVDINLEIEVDETGTKLPVSSFHNDAPQSKLADDLPKLDLGYEIHQASSSGDGFYWKFENIPYAEPPTGPNRFKAAIPKNDTKVENPEMNKGEKVAVCPQIQIGWETSASGFVYDYFYSNKDITPKWDSEITPADYPDYDKATKVPDQSEDCLTLDVMVSKRVYEKRESEQSTPVLVWIFGGGYVFGSKTLFGPPDGLFNAAKYLEDVYEEDFIFIAINYRLGAFGWLAGDDFESGGGFENAGLSDQLAALKWVQTFVGKFGGDKDSVTVMGQSAGASSIMHHITADGGEKDTPLFKRAIMQSPGFFPSGNRGFLNKTYNDFLTAAGVKDFAGLVGASTEKLMEANALTTYNSPYGRFAYGPVVDGTYVPDVPSRLLNEDRYHPNVDVMVSHNANEGAIFTPPWIRTINVFKGHMFSIWPNLTSEDVEDIAEYMYPLPEGDANARDKTAAVMQAFSDVAIDCNDYYISQAFNPYRYYFNIYPGIHGQDRFFTFYPGTAPADKLKANKGQAERMQRYITNFIKFGNPNTGEDSDPTWFKFNRYKAVMQIGDGVTKPISPLLPPTDTKIKMERDTTRTSQCRWWQSAPYLPEEGLRVPAERTKLLKQTAEWLSRFGDL